MAKSTSTIRKASKKPPQAAAVAEQVQPQTDNQAAPSSAAADTAIPAASGAEAKSEGAAAPDGGTEAKVSEGARNSGAADAVEPAGTAGAPAAQAEESRERAGAAAADRKVAAEEENQPEKTARSPVAGPAFIVRGPKKGFRRGGIAFGAEPRELTPADFDVEPGEQAEPAQLERLLSILAEPALRVTARAPDGSEEPVLPEVVEHLRTELAARRALDA